MFGKQQWVELFREIGLDEGQMRRWHAAFEQRYPDSHAEFLARLRIPQDEAIRGDWHSVERRVSPSGRIVLEASRGEGHHADRFWAAALGVYAADQAPGQREMLTVKPVQYARRGAW